MTREPLFKLMDSVGLTPLVEGKHQQENEEKNSAAMDAVEDFKAKKISIEQAKQQIAKIFPDPDLDEAA